jgi:hypothetical protein
VTHKNVLLFLIDALRYDVVADADLRGAMTPNIDRLVNGGYLGKVIANAGTTQFVLPSLTTQSYPLDNGGYDTGIRQRAMTFAELFKNAGYSTYLATSLDQFCMAHDFERGFDEIRGLFSFSATLKRLIMRKLSHEIALWRAGDQDEAATVAVVREELGLLLRKFMTMAENPPRLERRWWRANKHNAWIAKRCQAELELLEREPSAVLRKLEAIPPFYYWTVLGQKRADWRYQWVRVVSAAVAYSRRLFGWLPFVFPQYGSFQFSATDVAGGLPDKLGSLATPWLTYVHVMDVHSYRIYRGFFDLLAKARILPRLWRLRQAGFGGRPALHDLAIMRVDWVLGRVLDSLKQKGELDDTIIVVTGDHGQYLPGYGPRKLQDVQYRTFREHLEVPLVVHGSDRLPEPCIGLLDSMSIAATLLDAAGLEGHPSFKGVSAYAGGKPVVIAENAGRGSADISRKDLYFNVTGHEHSMKAVLRGKELEVLALYDHARDPDELRDVNFQDDKQRMVEQLLAALMSERSELFIGRGVNMPQTQDSQRTTATAP